MESGTANQTNTSEPSAGTSMGSSSAKDAKDGQLRWLLMAIVGAIMLLGGSAAAYVGVILPNRPQNVLKRALANALDSSMSKTVAFDGTLTLSGKDAPKDLTGATFEGAAAINGPFQATIVAAGSSKLHAEYRKVDTKSYLKVTGLDDLEKLLSQNGTLPAEEQSVVTAIKRAAENKWLAIGNNELGSLAPGASGSLLGGGLSAQDRRHIAEAYENNSFLIVKKELPDEAIKGQASRHFVVGIDKQKLKGFLQALKQTSIGSSKKTTDDINQFTKDIDKQNFDGATVEVWIAKGSKRFSQLAYNGTSKGTTSRITVTLTKWNAPVKVTAPADAQPLQSLLGQVLVGGDAATLTPTVPTSTRDAERQKDSTDISDELNLFYDSKGYYPSLANLQDANWVIAYMPNLPVVALTDPHGQRIGAARSDYSYEVTPVGCHPSPGEGSCLHYKLSIKTETGNAIVKQSP